MMPCPRQDDRSIARPPDNHTQNASLPVGPMPTDGSVYSDKHVEAWRKGTQDDGRAETGGLDHVDGMGAVYERVDGYFCTYFRAVPGRGGTRLQYA
jgi:hypothetical protein